MTTEAAPPIPVVGPKDSLVAKLRSFKPSGKWYDDWEVVVPGVTTETALYQVWGVIREMYAEKLNSGWFIEVTSVPEHPHDHPTLLVRRN